MPERTSPAHVLASEITRLEWEIDKVLAACSTDERATVEVLRERLNSLKWAARYTIPATR